MSYYLLALTDVTAWAGVPEISMPQSGATNAKDGGRTRGKGNKILVLSGKSDIYLFCNFF